jgi:hypothetical protein
MTYILDISYVGICLLTVEKNVFYDTLTNILLSKLVDTLYACLLYGCVQN